MLARCQLSMDTMSSGCGCASGCGRASGCGHVKHGGLACIDHKEVDVGMAECCDARYLSGMEPAEYSRKQEDMLAQNIRRHRAH